jgi:hypothetical protein
LFDYKEDQPKEQKIITSGSLLNDNETEETTPPVENRPKAENIEVKFSMSSIKVNTEVEYKILESVVEPKDPQKQYIKNKNQVPL